MSSMTRTAAAAATALVATTMPVAVNADVWGVDVSTAISSTDATCMLKQHNITYATARAWHSYGGYDPAAVVSGASVLGAGFTQFDVYMFPCSFGIPAEAQVQQVCLWALIAVVAVA